MESLNHKLRVAAVWGDIDELKNLLGQGAEINSIDTWGCNALHHASTFGKVEAVMFLLAFGADVNAKNQLGTGPLGNATQRGFIDVVLALINAGADIKEKDSKCRTLLHWAAMMDRTNMIPALIGDGTGLNSMDDEGKTPLDRSCAAQTLATYHSLISYGAVRTLPGRILCDFRSSNLTMRQAAVHGGLVDRLQVLLEQHPADGVMDSPETLAKLANLHSKSDVAAFLHALMAARAIDEVLQPVYSIRNRSR